MELIFPVINQIIHCVDQLALVLANSKLLRSFHAGNPSQWQCQTESKERFACRTC